MTYAAMTYNGDKLTDLVSELRERATNALEEGNGTANADARYFNASADVIEELMAALKPFADMARYCHDRDDDEQLCVVVADLRAARAAYLGEKE